VGRRFAPVRGATGAVFTNSHLLSPIPLSYFIFLSSSPTLRAMISFMISEVPA
jgi:hypothetical protein